MGAPSYRSMPAGRRAWHRSLAVGLVALVLATFGAAIAQQTAQTLRIGVVLPSRVNVPVVDRDESMVLAADSARRGAIYAEETLRETLVDEGFDLTVLVSTAPDAAAMARAAARMVAVEDVQVLIGGFDDEDAAALADVARARDRIFLNVGATSDRLRTSSPGGWVFHVEPSACDYLSAMARWSRERLDHERWFVIRAEDAEGETALEAARAAASAAGIELVETAVLPAANPPYADLVQSIEMAAPDAVLLLLAWHAQLEFLAQAEAHGSTTPVLALPDAVSQTRTFYDTSRWVAPDLGAGYRFAAWEPTVAEPEGRRLSDDFGQRWGEPMDGPAWTTYQGVRLAVLATLAAGSTEVDEIAEALAGLDVAGGFDERQQWVHDVFVAQIEGDAPPGQRRLSQQLAWASFAERLSGGCVSLDF